MERKVPPYAPYIMKLIKHFYPLSEEEAKDVDLALDCESHSYVRLVQKSAHVIQKQATMLDIDEDLVNDSRSRAPSNPKVKKAGPPKNRPWVVRAMEKMLCMGSELHKENYVAYEERHAILTNQSKIFDHLKIPNAPKPPKKLIPYEQWNAEAVNWNCEVEDDVDLDEDGNDPDA